MEVAMTNCQESEELMLERKRKRSEVDGDDLDGIVEGGDEDDRATDGMPVKKSRRLHDNDDINAEEPASASECGKRDEEEEEEEEEGEEKVKDCDLTKTITPNGDVKNNETCDSDDSAEESVGQRNESPVINGSGGDGKDAEVLENDSEAERKDEEEENRADDVVKDGESSCIEQRTVAEKSDEAIAELNDNVNAPAVTATSIDAEEEAVVEEVEEEDDDVVQPEEDTTIAGDCVQKSMKANETLLTADDEGVKVAKPEEGVRASSESDDSVVAVEERQKASDKSDDAKDADQVAKEVVELKDESVVDVDKDGCESEADKNEPTVKDEGKDREQTIIITETKSLAKAINDAVKQPDGKPTLVIIETKPGASSSTAAAGTVATGSTTASPSNGLALSARSSTTAANVPPRRLTPMPTLQSQLSVDFNGGRGPFAGSRPVGRPSLLQGTLLASSLTRFTPKPDPGPSVPLPDDAEVSVDVPSLVVPYLFECQARETLAHFLKKLGPLDDAASDAVAAAIAPKPAATEPMSPTAAAIDAVARGAGIVGSGGGGYFDSTLGKFLMDIGLVQVQEWVQGEILRAQQRKLNKGWKTKEREKMVAGLKRTMEDSKRRTGQFRFALRKCPRCAFQSESSTVLDKHMETIHLAPGSISRMLCCFCDYATDETAAIFNHVYVKHGAFARLEKFHNCHMCPLCPFEDANKARVTRHTWKCQKAYAPERNLAPAPDYEPPAKRTRLVASVATLKSMAASRQQQQLQQQQSSNVLRDNLLGRGVSGPPPIRPKPGDLRGTQSYVHSVLRSSYVPPSSNVSRTVSQLLTSAHQSYVRSASAPGPRFASPGGGTGTLLLSRNQLPGSVNQPYSIQPSQLYQVVNPGSGGGGGGGSGGAVLPVVRGTVGPFQSPPRFTILPTPTATVTTRGPTPVALIPNLATTGHSGSFAAQLRTTPSLGSAAAQIRGASGVARPNISITPVNKGTTSRPATAQPTSASGARLSGQQQQQQQHQGGGSNSSYVVCEICDGYIKDLDQLRNHMQWIHKVKIHPKMIHNRPPLNCQKCHYRFFTDQGLERHLLGSHGLVTSSMQDNANKGKDGGRCIICGKVFLWKLVVHMAKDHKMTLKPAHLSYKCTVCSATFNMYRLFETHVYEEHSTVAKRVLDTPKAPTSGSSGGSSGTSSSMGSSKAKATSAAVSSSKDVVTVRSVSSSSSVTVSEIKASSAVANRKPSAEQLQQSPMRLCVECGIKFQCSSNCLDHLKESHVKPCRVELCRVDKCHKCTAKSDIAMAKKSTSRVAEADEVQLVKDDDDDDDDDDVVELVDGKETKKTPTPAPDMTKSKTVVIVERETAASADDQGGEDVFDMEVETVDDHSDPGSVHTDVESD